MVLKARLEYFRFICYVENERVRAGYIGLKWRKNVKKHVESKNSSGYGH